MQLSLPLARNTDPVTSHQAASQAVALQARHVAIILQALKDAAPYGLTKDEIAEVTRLDATQVARRGKDGLGSLWRVGPETRQGNTGRACRVWFAL